MFNKTIIGIAIGAAALGAVACVCKLVKRTLDVKQDLNEIVEVFEEGFEEESY